MEAIKKGFKQAEHQFLDHAVQAGGEALHDGSCATVALIVDDTCYIANVGDSRALLSENQGTKTLVLTRDHKPTDEQEK